MTESAFAAGHIVTPAEFNAKLQAPILPAEIDDDAVETAKIADLAVTAAKLAAGAVITSKLLDTAVKLPKLGIDWVESIDTIPNSGGAFATVATMPGFNHIGILHIVAFDAYPAHNNLCYVHIVYVRGTFAGAIYAGAGTATGSVESLSISLSGFDIQAKGGHPTFAPGRVQYAFESYAV